MESVEAGWERERETWVRDRQQLDSRREMEVMAVDRLTNKLPLTASCCFPRCHAINSNWMR